jgi:hypothetical protein
MKELAGDIQWGRNTVEKKREGINSKHNDGHQLNHVEERGDCVVCRSLGEGRSRVHYKCEVCSVYVCVFPCYDIHRNSSDI